MLLITYTNWANRFVPRRTREVIYADGFWNARKALEHTLTILQIAIEIREASDLTPRLSSRIMTHGYVPARFDRLGRRKGPEWGNKDFALNAYDIHHLHLGHEGKQGKDLLYASFGRESATLLLVGDHNSFDDGSVARAAAQFHAGGSTVQTPYSDKDRKTLHRAGISTFEVVDGRFYIGTELSSDGSSTVRYVNHLARVLRATDPLVDDPFWCAKLFSDQNLKVPQNPDFEWKMQWCDLVLFENSSNIGFLVAPWRR